MPLPTHRAWKAGDPFSASHLNESSEKVRSLFPMTGHGISIIPGVSGTSFYVEPSRGGGLAKLPVFQYVGMGYFTVANDQGAGAYPFAVQTV